MHELPSNRDSLDMIYVQKCNTHLTNGKVKYVEITIPMLNQCSEKWDIMLDVANSNQALIFTLIGFSHPYDLVSISFSSLRWW